MSWSTLFEHPDRWNPKEIDSQLNKAHRQGTICRALGISRAGLYYVHQHRDRHVCDMRTETPFKAIFVWWPRRYSNSQSMTLTADKQTAQTTAPAAAGLLGSAHLLLVGLAPIGSSAPHNGARPDQPVAEPVPVAEAPAASVGSK